MAVQGAEGTTTVASPSQLIEPLHRGKFWLQLVGVLTIVMGIVQVAGAVAALLGGNVLALIPGAIIAALLLWMGVLLMGAARELGRGHDGDDSQAIQRGLARLRTYFTIIGVLTLIGLIVMVLVLGLALTMGLGSFMAA